MTATIVTCPLCEDSFSMDEYGSCKNHFYTSAYTYKINKEFYCTGIKELYEDINAKYIFERLVQQAYLYEKDLFRMLKLMAHLENIGLVIQNISKTSAGVVIKLKPASLIKMVLEDSFFLLVEEIKYKKHQSYFTVTINPDNLRLFKYSS